jgi:hypothetical protein
MFVYIRMYIPKMTYYLSLPICMFVYLFMYLPKITYQLTPLAYLPDTHLPPPTYYSLVDMAQTHLHLRADLPID